MTAAARHTSRAAPDSEIGALEAVRARVESYYSAKLARHGAVPMGVDWSCEATQSLRFVQLLKLCDFGGPFSLNDLGCGYGALARFLALRHPATEIDYLGVDLSRTMIQRARRRHRGNLAVRFAIGATCPREADYSVASGIMNVSLGFPLPLWESFVRGMMTDLHAASRRGFAVNFVAERRPDVPPDQLYRADPSAWRRFCESDLGCSVEILDRYGLREFTLLARRPRHREQTAGG